MNAYYAYLFWVTVGLSVLPFPIELADYSPTRKPGNVEAPCQGKCQGDFPVSSNRKYAQAPEAFHSS